MKRDYKVIIVMLFGILAVIAIQRVYFSDAGREQRLLKVVSDLNQKCPMTLDKETELEGVAILKDSLEVIYTCVLINSIKDSVSISDFREHIEPIVMSNTRDSLEFRPFRAKNMTVSYVYKDKNGDFILKISIPSEKYRQGLGK
jgi:hypothetical protein